MPQPDSTASSGDTAGRGDTASSGSDTIPEPGELLVADSPEGMCWTWELDMAGMLAAIGATQFGDPDDQEAALAEEREAVEAGDAKPRDLTGLIADHLPAGPGLAAWLANAPAEGLSDWDLPGIAAAYRRVAAWAQAGELSAVAAIASRTAARNEKVGVDEQGKPARVTPGAASEVSLALVMSQSGASRWANLAVQLQWRLAKTGAALAAGTIDLARARLIAEATGPLDDETAQTVEDSVLPKAGQQTTGQLHWALRRAVIAADPEGADERRRAAESRAKLSLYPDQVGTASLVGSNLPGVHAAAAMARVTALAQAMKAAGAGGGIHLLRAQVFVGLLLGTLPFIQPPDGAPPDPEPGAGPDPGAGDWDDDPDTETGDWDDAGGGYGEWDDGSGPADGYGDQDDAPGPRAGGPTGDPGGNDRPSDPDEAAHPDASYVDELGPADEPGGLLFRAPPLADPGQPDADDPAGIAWPLPPWDPVGG